MRSSQPETNTGELEGLMQRYQQSEAEAAGMLVEKLSPQIFQLYLAQLRNRTLAEDLLQDFWLRIHNARHTYRPGEPLLPWIYAIAHRVRIDSYRRSRRITAHEFQSDEVLANVVAQQPERTNDLGLAELLRPLPESQREIILLTKVSGLSLQEAARATGTSVGAVKQKAHRAYETLRKLFGAQHEL